MKKKVLLFLALLCMVAQGAWAASGSWSDEGNRDTSWGTNYESASSFTIENAAQLAQFAYMVNNGQSFSGKTVTLGADIDLSAHYWVPIGCERSSYNTFNGTFDGALHTIRGMETTFTTESYDSNSNANVYGYHMGLFGDIWDSTKATVIKRVKLAKSTITGREYVGGIVGRNEGATIEGCHVAEDVKIIVTVTKADRIGGIAGVNSTGVIKYCSSKVVIDANENSELSFCGGIVGDNGSEIYYCLFVGDQIDGTEYVGGIAGRSSGNYVKLEHNIYYTSNSNLKGVNGEDSENIYPAKKVTLGDDGFSIKMRDSDFTYIGFMKWSSYNVNYVIVLDDIIYSATGKEIPITHTLPEAGYDYDLVLSDNTAAFDDYRGFTWVKIGNDDLTITFETSKAFDGEGTEESPFLIQSIADINKLSKISNGILPVTFEGSYFKLTTDLTFSGTENEFMPISYKWTYNEPQYPFNRYFSGHFDGNGHIVSGLNVKYDSDYRFIAEMLGFFGKISNGSVKNLVIKNSTFSTKNEAGAIVGIMTQGVIENCHVGSDVTIKSVDNGYQSVGGIVGYGKGTIKGCTCAATIVFPAKNGYANEVGGIAGYFGGTMQDCLYYGNATAFNYYDADPQNQNEYDHSHIGTLVGRATNDLTLSRNLYDKKKANLAAIGTDYYEVSDLDGASGAYIMTINQPEYLGNTLDLISLTGDPAATYAEFENLPKLKAYDGVIDLDGTYYVKPATSVALSTGDKYRATINVTTAAVEDNTFTMPEADVTVTATDIARKEWGGSGTEADPYTIANVAAMNALAEEVNGSNTAACFSGQYFKMTADIDYSNEADTKDNNWSNYSPVGYMNSESTGRPFSGVFDGDGHTLSGININRPTDGRITQGVFGLIGDDVNTSGPVVKNLKLANSNIVAIDNTYVGGIVGGIYIKGMVDNCEVASDVKFGIHSGENPDKVFIGGIVGGNQSSNSTISNCFSEANFVLGSEAHAYNTGAIIGLNEGGTLTKNYYRISNAEVKGVGAADNFTGTDVDGANAALALTFNEVDGGTSSTDTEATVTHNGTGYFIAGNAVNLKYEGTYNDNGYTFSTDSEGATINGNTLTVGTEDVEINTAINISLSNTENNDEVLKTMKHSVNVTLKDRRFSKDGSWYTLCLPFDVEIAGSPLDNATVKTLASSSFDHGTLTLNFEDATRIEAGKPYIVKWNNSVFSSDIVNPMFSNTTISATEAQAIETTYTNFVGTFSPVTLAANDKSVLFLGAGNKLYWPSADVPVNSCRAYFKLNGITAGDPSLSAGVRGIILNFDDETTGIQEVIGVNEVREVKDNSWYTLDGRRLSGKPTQHGIYINNGNKVVIK